MADIAAAGDDERTGVGAKRLHVLAAGIVTAMGGRIEPVAGDELLAVFEHATAAVEAAVRI